MALVGRYDKPCHMQPEEMEFNAKHHFDEVFQDTFFF
jgi:hypothetical protein